MSKVVIGLFIASYVIVLCITFLLITIYLDMHDVTLSRFVFLSQLFNGCAGMPYLFFNARRDSLGLSTVINTMYIFFYFSLCPMRYLSRTCETPQRHAPTTTPLPLPKRRARFMLVTASNPLPNSTGPYLVYGDRKSVV